MFSPSFNSSLSLCKSKILKFGVSSCRQLTICRSSASLVYGNIFSLFRRQFDDNSRRFHVAFVCRNSRISDKSLKIQQRKFAFDFLGKGNKQKHFSVLFAANKQVTSIGGDTTSFLNNSQQFSKKYLRNITFCRRDNKKMALAPKVKLNNGMEMPALGLGTYLAKDNEGEIAVKHAIDVGYRHFDTAYFYQNESQVGKAINDKINEGIIKREDVFIVTKLWNIHHAKDKVEHACRKSLENLCLDYIDLYLIHIPVGYAYIDDETLLPKDDEGKLMLSDIDYLETYKAMEELVKLGLVKSIGVSNFNSEQIERILQNCEIKPVTNQVECHPALNQKKLIKFCKDRDITLTAYCPLGRPKPEEKKPDFMYSEITAALATKYNKTPAQIVLRYLIDIGTIPIPKSANKERIEENFNVFDFKLSDEDICVMDTFNTGDRLVPFPLIKGQNHKYYPFNIEF